METEARTWSKFPTGGKASEEKILAWEETNPKEQDFESNSQGFE